MKNSLIRCITIIIFSFIRISLSAYNSPNLFPDTLQNGVNIEKTIAKLVAGQQVRIVYFGQSIISATGVVNWWPDTITQYLKAKYPAATITVTNVPKEK